MTNNRVAVETYSQSTGLTAIYSHRGDNIVYPLLGLVAEIGELLLQLEETGSHTEAMRSEMGDCLWYISETCHNLGIEMSALFSNGRWEFSSDSSYYDLSELRHRYTILATDAVSVAQKIMRIAGNDIPLPFRGDDKRRAAAENALLFALGMLLDLVGVSGSTFSKIAKENLDKLKARSEKGTISR